MPLPVTITTREVHIDIRTSTGDPGVGTVDFTRRAALRDHDGALILGPGTTTVELDEDGQATVDLPVTDDEDVTPQDWAWTVRVATDAWQDRFAISLPAGDLSTLELADIAPAVTPITSVTYALASALTAEIADRAAADTAHADLTEDVHGIGDTAVLETQTGAQDRVDDLATALASVYLALAGGVLTGDLEIQGDGKGYRLRRGGSALDLEATGVDLLLSVWSGGAYDGTQRSYARFSADAQNVQWAGRQEIVAALYGAAVHALDPITGVAELGGKNGLAAIRLVGFKATAGAPTTGTWATGEVVLASDGAWHLCTAGGTPGTWT